MQLTVVFSMVGAHFTLSLIYVLAMLFGTPDDLGPTSADARNLGIAVAGLYFGLGLFVTTVVGLVVTQRIAGPVIVIERAVRGIRSGDFTQRTHLRSGDHLVSLATEVGALQDDLGAVRTERNMLLESLGEALSVRDFGTAVRLQRDLTLLQASPSDSRSTATGVEDELPVRIGA